MASAEDEPVISVPSSPGKVDEEDVPPGKEEPILTPEKGRDAMVCIQATRSSQTPPLIVPDIHRALEGTGVLERPDHNWTMVCRILNVIIVRERWDPYTDIRL